jgi:hypothetical protein
MGVRKVVTWAYQQQHQILLKVREVGEYLAMNLLMKKTFQLFSQVWKSKILKNRLGALTWLGFLQKNLGMFLM